MHPQLVNTPHSSPTHTAQTQLPPHLETCDPQMAQNIPVANQDDLGEIFFKVFQKYTKDIINSLHPQKDETLITTAADIIVAQIMSDHNRLLFIIDTIQTRVKKDVVWIDSAICLYNGIAHFINPSFSGPGLPADKRGMMVLQHYLVDSIQNDFNEDVTQLLWNVGLIHFIGRLGAARESIGTLTPHSLFYVLNRMMVSDSLFVGENLGLCFDYIVHVGPYLDSEASGAKDEFTGMLMQLRERVKMLGGSVARMAMRWMFKLREDGWRAQQDE